MERGNTHNPDRKKTRAEKHEEKMAKEEQKRLRREERREAKARRSKGGAFAMKNGRTHFGYKVHNNVGVNIPLIRQFVVTTASLHDANVDLSTPGVPCYRDKRDIRVHPAEVSMQPWIAPRGINPWQLIRSGGTAGSPGSGHPVRGLTRSSRGDSTVAMCTRPWSGGSGSRPCSCALGTIFSPS